MAQQEGTRQTRNQTVRKAPPAPRGRPSHDTLREGRGLQVVTTQRRRRAWPTATARSAASRRESGSAYRQPPVWRSGHARDPHSSPSRRRLPSPPRPSLPPRTGCSTPVAHLSVHTSASPAPSARTAPSMSPWQSRRQRLPPRRAGKPPAPPPRAPPSRQPTAACTRSRAPSTRPPTLPPTYPAAAAAAQMGEGRVSLTARAGTWGGHGGSAVRCQGQRPLASTGGGESWAHFQRGRG